VKNATAFSAMTWFNVVGE